jgi:GR25 family glycosyltransferase involved in LPS biosynthesis
MMKNNWEHVLILEDDVVLDKNITQKFKSGMKELKQKKVDWDMLYLGCGGQCGHKGVSFRKSKNNKYESTWQDMDVFVSHPYDLRTPCDKKDCPSISKHISVAQKAGGTWGYAYSRKGAEKFLNTLVLKSGKDKGVTKVDDHIDQLLMKTHHAHGLKVIAFDLPIIWHEYGVAQRDKFSTIEW